MYDDFPEKNKKRNIRRKQKQKKIQKAEDIFSQRYHMDKLNERYTHDWAIRHADNMKSCSCYMCGNRRKYEGESRKEKLNKIREKEQSSS